MELVLSVDVGTTNIKAGVVDENGKILSFARKEIQLETSSQGMAEHDPEEIFKNFTQVCRKVSKNYRKKIKFLTISSYQLGLIALDKNLKPLTKLITLLDTRPQETFAKLKNKCNYEKIYKNTGCPPFPQYPFSKIFWLKEKKKDVFNRTRYFLSSKDYIIYRLCGEIITEPSISSATQLMNIHKVEWDDYATEILGIEKKQLPQIVPSEKNFCKLPTSTKHLLGLTEDIFLLPGVYDGGALVIGTGGFYNKIATINIGTTAMFRTLSNAPVLDKSNSMRLQTYYLCYGKWITGAGLNNAGNAIEWVRKIFSIKKHSILFSLARKAHNNNDGSKNKLYFLPYFTGERDPRIGSMASGIIYGLRQHHNVGNIILSLLEGIGYSLRTIYDSMAENNIEIKKARIGGSVARNPFFIEIISNILNLPIEIPKCVEPTLIGNAILCLTANGRYPDIYSASGNIKVLRRKEEIKPSKKDVQFYDTCYQRFLNLIEKINMTNL